MDTDQDNKDRLQKILFGAFSGPPTPLKDIPTRAGESRKLPKRSDEKQRDSERAYRGPRASKHIRGQ